METWGEECSRLKYTMRESVKLVEIMVHDRNGKIWIVSVVELEDMGLEMSCQVSRLEGFTAIAIFPCERYLTSYSKNRLSFQIAVPVERRYG